MTKSRRENVHQRCSEILSETSTLQFVGLWRFDFSFLRWQRQYAALRPFCTIKLPSEMRSIAILFVAKSLVLVTSQRAYHFLFGQNGYGAT